MSTRADHLRALARVCWQFGGEGGGSPWGMLSTDQRRVIVTNRLACAQRAGLLGADGALRSVR